MEGFPVTRQTEQDCRRLLNGTVTPQQMAAEILARRARQKD